MPKTLRGSFDQALRPLPSVVKVSSAKEEGVGGTRALAHSINVLRVCKNDRQGHCIHRIPFCLQLQSFMATSLIVEVCIAEAHYRHLRLLIW